MTTWTRVLKQWVDRDPDVVLYQFLGDGERVTEALTRGDVDRGARTVAARLREEGARPGDRALLVFAPGLDFVTAFFGCIYAGVVAVPTYPPRPGGSLATLESIARQSRAEVALTSDALVPILGAVAARSPVLAAIRPIGCGGPARPSGGDPIDATPSDLVMLQYTSGSTGDPRGVMLDHANLLHNEQLIARAFGHGPGSTVVGWLPTHHDMGLIGNVLQPAMLGTRCVLMAPHQFLERPLRWLRAVAAHGGTTSGGPNFAYELCLRAYDPHEMEGVDLSGWAVAFNGAEPIRHDTLTRFAERFAPHGFRPRSFLACYGLAEASLIVSGGPAGHGVRHLRVDREALENATITPSDRGVPAISCGPTWTDVAIVADGVEVQPGQVGEIWVQGASVAQGYFERPAETEQVFGARVEGRPGRWLRTGDLGFTRDGELFVTGRLKDLILYHGRNLYPQDLELTAERSHAAIRPGCVAAFDVDLDPDVGVVVVVEVRDAASAAEVVAQVRQAVGTEHDLPLTDVVVVPARTLTKTSSGKIRRRPTRAAYLDSRYAAVRYDTPLPPRAAPLTDPVQRATAEAFASVLGVAPPDLDTSFAALGGDSLRAATAVARLEERFGVTLDRSALDPFTVRTVADAIDRALVDLLATWTDDEVERHLTRLTRATEAVTRGGAE